MPVKQCGPQSTLPSVELAMNIEHRHCWGMYDLGKCWSHGTLTAKRHEHDDTVIDARFTPARGFEHRRLNDWLPWSGRHHVACAVVVGACGAVVLGGPRCRAAH